jgi:ubiquinone/menaquinone biosynthesis C-methylase UbiE
MTEKTTIPRHELRIYPDSGLHHPLTIHEHKARYLWAVQTLGGLAAKGEALANVVDLGSGEGYGTDMLRKAGFATRGIDLSAQDVTEACEKYGDYFQTGDVKQLPWADQSIDTVCCFEVIEHFPEPEIAMREAMRVLRPGGYYLLSTPNVKVFVMAGAHPDHFKEYTAQEMLDLLAQCGFVVHEWYGQSLNAPVATKLYHTKFSHWYVTLKRSLGINGPLLKGKARHGFEKLTTGHTSAELSEADWVFKAHDETAPQFMFLAQRPLN